MNKEWLEQKYVNERLSLREIAKLISFTPQTIRNGDLNVDHIKPFAVIITENNIKTIKELYNCKELWDLKNGRTLCVSCHEETDTFGEGTKKMLRMVTPRKD